MTDQATQGGFAGDLAEAFTPPAAGSCCGSAPAAEGAGAASQSACCGAPQVETTACCGSSAQSEATGSSAGCCG